MKTASPELQRILWFRNDRDFGKRFPLVICRCMAGGSAATGDKWKRRACFEDKKNQRFLQIFVAGPGQAASPAGDGPYAAASGETPSDAWSRAWRRSSFRSSG